jgi:hypothetical protein
MAELNLRKIKKNLKAVALAASDAEWATGALWYPHHSHIILRIAQRNEVDPSIATAAFAAMSPGLSIEANIVELESMIKAIDMGLTSSDWKPHRVPYSFNDTFGKAWRLLTGVLPIEDAFKPATAPKTHAFFLNLAHNHDAVTVDGHIVNAAMNGTTRIGISSKNLNLTTKRYRDIASVVSELASEFDVKPAELQAIIWTVYRSMAFERKRE